MNIHGEKNTLSIGFCIYPSNIKPLFLPYEKKRIKESMPPSELAPEGIGPLSKLPRGQAHSGNPIYWEGTCWDAPIFESYSVYSEVKK